MARDEEFITNWLTGFLVGVVILLVILLALAFLENAELLPILTLVVLVCVIVPYIVGRITWWVIE